MKKDSILTQKVTLSEVSPLDNVFSKKMVGMSHEGLSFKCSNRIKTRRKQIIAWHETWNYKLPIMSQKKLRWIIDLFEFQGLMLSFQCSDTTQSRSKWYTITATWFDQTFIDASQDSPVNDSQKLNYQLTEGLL